jgi:hypothetical protein
LQMVHEFIADGASIATGDTEIFARMLLQAYDDGRYLDPSHHFFHSPIKRRLRMISSSKSPSRWRMALALPLLLAVMVLACSKEQGAPAQAQIPKSLSLTLAKKFKMFRDSIQVASGTGFKKVFILEKAIQDGQVVRVNFKDSVKLIGQLTDDQNITVTGMQIKYSQVPPPPPPKK